MGGSAGPLADGLRPPPPPRPRARSLLSRRPLRFNDLLAKSKKLVQNKENRVRPRPGGDLGGFKYAVLYSGKPGFLGGARSHAKVLAR